MKICWLSVSVGRVRKQRSDGNEGDSSGNSRAGGALCICATGMCSLFLQHVLPANAPTLAQRYVLVYPGSVKFTTNRTWPLQRVPGQGNLFLKMYRKSISLGWEMVLNVYPLVN